MRRNWKVLAQRLVVAEDEKAVLQYWPARREAGLVALERRSWSRRSALEAIVRVGVEVAAAIKLES